MSAGGSGPAPPPPSYDEVVKGGTVPSAPSFPEQPQQYPPGNTGYGQQPPYPASSQSSAYHPPTSQGYSTQPMSAPYPPTGGAPYPGQTAYYSQYPQSTAFGQPVQHTSQPGQPAQYTYGMVTAGPTNVPASSYQTTPLAYGNTTRIGSQFNNRRRAFIIVFVMVMIFIIMIIIFVSVSRF